MPYQLTVTLAPDGPVELPDNCGRALHAQFLAWLQQGDEALANHVHDEMQPRPFTLSPLRPQKNGHLQFHLNLLQDELWDGLWAGMAESARLELLNNTFRLVQDELKLDRRTYEDLADAGVETLIRLRFLSPTAFRSNDMNYPLPDPVKIYQSWLARWNQFAPQQVRYNISLLDVVQAHIAPSYLRIETDVLNFGNYKLIGFHGLVSLRIMRPRALGREILGRLNALADYATYCGTGHRTSMGMGHTKRLG